MDSDIEMERTAPPPWWRKLLAFAVCAAIVGALLIVNSRLGWEFGLGFLAGIFCVLFWFRLKFGYWLDYR